MSKKISNPLIKLLKHLVFTIIILNSFHSISQDIIIKKNGDTVEAKIELIDTNEIHYKRYDNLEGPLYIISKRKLKQITFENGSTEFFDNQESKPEKTISLEETKAFIVETINNHGYDRDAFKWKYLAQFEGDYLRLTHFKKNSDTKLKDEGLLYDFSNVYKFQNVSERSDQLAFLNIWVSVCQNEKKNKWDKEKLVMRIDDPEIAQSLLKALKHYNKLLLERDDTDKKDSKF